MVLEATMICVDNSEWMRNGDYPPSRFQAQADAVNVVCGTKTQSNLENTVGVIAMAGKGVRVLVVHTGDAVDILCCMHGLEVEGEANLTAAIQVAQMALKHRQNKNQQQRIVVFVGSPVRDEKSVLEEIGKKLKKNNVSLDVIDFGESDDQKPEKLEALVAAVNSGGNSYVIHVPPGEISLSDALISSPIITVDRGGMASTAASGASRFEFGVDPNVDPDLAQALRLSMEEEKARQEAVAAAKRTADKSPKAETKVESSTSDTDTIISQEDTGSDIYFELFGEDIDSGAKREADSEMSDDPSHDLDMKLAHQICTPEGKIDAQQSNVSKDQSDVTSTLNSLPGVDPNDPTFKDMLAPLPDLEFDSDLALRAQEWLEEDAKYYEAESAADAEMPDGPSHLLDLTLADQMNVQEEKPDTQSRKVFEIPDLNVEDVMASFHDQWELEKGDKSEEDE